jgi:hypothetical protein
MTTQTNTATGNGAPRFNPDQPLKLISDQAESWETFREPIRFEEAAEKILAAAKADGERVDQGIGDISTWAFGPMPDGTAAIAPIPAPGRPKALLPLRQKAFGQICERVGAPSEYIATLPAKFQMALLNYGFGQHKEKQVLARLANSEVRAIVSSRYAPLDDPFVLDVVHECLDKSGLLEDVRVRAVATGPTTALRCTFPKLAKAVKVGDVVEHGFDVLNGEVGERSLIVNGNTFRLACLNGARVNDKTSFRHVGDPARISEAFRDALPVVIAGGEALRERMTESVDRLVGDLLAEFDGLRAFGLDAGTTKAVAKDLLAERGARLPAERVHWAEAFATVGQVAAFDVFNSITSVAQTRGTESRLSMEEAAGRYLVARTS